MKLSEACELFLEDAEARKLRPSTRRGYGFALRLLHEHYTAQGKLDLRDVTEQSLRAWRATWKWSTSTHTLLLRVFKIFFRFAVQAKWIDVSPVAHIKAPKRDERPTLPLSRAELQDLLEAAGKGTKEEALILLMRFSGLSIQDAVTLSHSAIDDNGHLTLRRAKSGELVMTYLPRKVWQALHRFPSVSKQYFFWTGNSQPESAAKYWQARLRRVARNAKVEDFRPHRLRDTFAVELLVAGVTMEDVSALLGHSSIKITEKYYAPWNRSRRDRLVAVMKRAHRRDPLLKELAIQREAGIASTNPRLNDPTH